MLLIDEGFEGAGIPAGWSTNGTIDWDYTPALIGNKSAKVTDTGTINATPGLFAAQTDIWVSYTFKVSAFTGNTNLFYIQNGSSQNAGYLQYWNSTQTLRFYHGTISSVIGSVQILPNSQYYVWLHYVQGSGSNGVSQVYVSNNGTRPSTPDISQTDGNSTYDVRQWRLYDWTTVSDYIFDGLKISTTELFNYPSMGNGFKSYTKYKGW